MSTIASTKNNDSNDATNPTIEQKSYYTILTNHKRFRQLASWAFHMCDIKKNGTIDRHELYTGIILVHLQLAKYAGIAACYPPTYDVIEQLFIAADDDQSNHIDEEEFIQIVVICCGQIMSRIIIYYTFIILLVPFVADRLIQLFMTDAIFKHNPLDRFMSIQTIAEKIVAFLMFLLLVPKFFDWIDSYSKQSAELTKTNKKPTTTNPTDFSSSNVTKKSE
jgi:EF hand